MPRETQPVRICPRCHSEYRDYPALSRVDNETLICPPCGTSEALHDFKRLLRGIDAHPSNTP